MCANDNRLGTSHSYHASEAPKLTQTNAYSKSDLNFLATSSAKSGNSNKTFNLAGGNCIGANNGKGEYYKKYEHDEVPVKDSDSFVIPMIKGSLTNSDLDKLENRIYSNISEELQADNADGPLTNLESNIKFFKTTVEKIFENFYTSMRDFEHYKKRFHEILDRSKGGSVDDMEEFIKDMFDHIMTFEARRSSTSNINRHSTEIVVTDVVDNCVSSCGDSSVEAENGKRIVEAYKNENYSTDSTLPDNSSITKPGKLDDLLNIFLLVGNPCLEIKLDGRNLVSEINLKKPTQTVKMGAVASADNLKKLAAKKLELENYIRQQHDGNMPDRDIPVRISCAKKDIHLNEDFKVRLKEDNEASQSFLSKICNIICKKFRRSSIG